MYTRGVWVLHAHKVYGCFTHTRGVWVLHAHKRCMGASRTQEVLGTSRTQEAYGCFTHTRGVWVLHAHEVYGCKKSLKKEKKGSFRVEVVEQKG